MSDDLHPEIRISVIADTQRGQQSMAAIQQLVAGARAEVEKFAQSGGLERLGKGNLDAARQRIDELETTLVSSERKMQLLDQAIATVGEDSPALDGLIDRFDELQKSTQGAVEELVKMPDALEESAQAAEKLTTKRTSRSGADAVGGFERPLMQISGSLGSFAGNTAFGSALRLGAEVSGSIEAFGRLGESLKGVTKEGFNTSLALAGIGLAITGVTIVAKDSKKSLQEFIQAQEATRQRTAALRTELEQLASSQDIEALKAANAARRAALVEEIDALQQKIADSGNMKARDLFNVDESTLGKPAALLFDALGVNADEAQQQLQKLNDELQTLDDSTAQLNSALAELSVQAKEAAADTSAQFDLNRRLLEIRKSGSSADLEKLRQDANTDIEAARQTISTQSDKLRELLLEQARLVFPNVDDFLRRGNVAPENQISELQKIIQSNGGQITPGIIELQNSIDGMNDKIADANDVIQRTYNPTLNAEVQVHELAAKTSEEYQKALEESKKAAEEAAETEATHAQALLDDAAKTSQSIAQLEKSRADQLAKQQQADAEAAVVAGFRSQIDAAKAAEAERTRADKITALRQGEQGKEIEALQKHEQDKAKAQAAFDLQQKRRLEDLADDENEAAADRDVRSFLRIQKQGQKELDRAQEDNDLRQREQDTALTEQIRELRKDANERIRVERDSGQRRITQVQRLEQQLADYQVNLARQRQQQERQIQAQSYQEQITAWRTHLNQVSQELMTGLVSPLRGALGLIGGSAVAPLPVGAGVGAGALRGGVSVALTIQQQNNGRFASAEDLVRVENNNRTMLQSAVQMVETAVRRARTNTGGR